jgi:hypothetical protein
MLHRLLLGIALGALSHGAVPAFAEPVTAPDAVDTPSQATFPEAAPSSSSEGPSTAAAPEPAPETAAAETPKVPAAAPSSLDMSGDRESSKEASEMRPEEPRLQRTVWGLSLRFGGTFASEELLTASYTDGSSETLSTGGGVNFLIGTFLIPLKFGSHSLGFGFEGGTKFSSIGRGSDTTVSFSRTVFVPRAQYGYELKPGIHWITSAGAQYETGVTLEAKGGFVGSTAFDSTWGYFGETGFLLDIGVFGLDLTFRHTRIDYALPDGPSISGNSLGVFCSVNVGILKTENLSARPEYAE